MWLLEQWTFVFTDRFTCQKCSNSTRLHLHTIPVQLDPVLHSHPQNVTLLKVLLLSFSLTVAHSNHHTLTSHYINYSHAMCHRLLVSFSKLQCRTVWLLSMNYFAWLKVDLPYLGSRNIKSLTVTNDDERSETGSREALGGVRGTYASETLLPQQTHWLKNSPSANQSNWM